MADFLANVLAQRRMAQAQGQAQQMMMYRLMQARAQEAQRQRQAAMQTAIQNRMMHQNDFSNQLNLENLRMRQDESARRDEADRRREEDRRRNLDRLELAARRGPLKPGYRWKGPDSTEQELIEGGPEWTKLRAAHAGDLNKLQSVNNSTQELTRTIDYILDKKNKSGFNSNFGGWNAYITRMLPNIIPGFAHTSDVGSAIDRLNELAEVSGLSGVRGGAGQSVGAITEREWPKFAAQLLKLNPRMDEDTARLFLKEARATALGIRNREMGAYENEWKPTPFFNKDPLNVPDPGQPAPRAPAAAAAGVPQGIDPQLWAHMSDQDKALWQTPPAQ